MKPRYIEEISSKLQEKIYRKWIFNPVVSLTTMISLRHANFKSQEDCCDHSLEAQCLMVLVASWLDSNLLVSNTLRWQRLFYDRRLEVHKSLFVPSCWFFI